MGAGAQVIHHSKPVLDVQYRSISKDIEESEEFSPTAVTPAASPPLRRQATRMSGPVPVEVAVASELDLRTSGATPNDLEPMIFQFTPSIRSGSFADIGHRRDMEDEHIRIDDLSAHLGSIFTCPSPSAFYGIFDGHGGPDAAAYIKRHAIRLFFEDVEFPQASDANNVFIESVENSMRKAFLLADLALADDLSVSSSSGTTALTAMIFGRLLLVANAGDCRAVLCRKGRAVDMSQDHKPIHAAEKQRVEECGGFIDDGYLNGMLSVSRALGDWDIKHTRGSPSPLISEPEFMQVVLMEEDEFLIIGCDGIWDVMTSQQAVNVVRREIRRHDDPERCARELVLEALRLKTVDNLTVIVVRLSAEHWDSAAPPEQQQRSQQQGPRLRTCGLSNEAICNLRNWLER